MRGGKRKNRRWFPQSAYSFFGLPVSDNVSFDVEGQSPTGGASMRRNHGPNQLTAPIRSILIFPLFQLAVVVVVILLLQAGDDNSARGQMFNGLDKLVESTVGLVSATFNVRSFTRSWLTTGFWIAYVYLACLVILALLRFAITKMIDFFGRTNLFYLRNAIARERGIAAYRAWVPFERIRPVNIPQEKWEETFAWPADNEPPYPSLARRILQGAISYLAVLLVAATLLQLFTPFPALTWLGGLMKM
jgi:hypothetical protein